MMAIVKENRKAKREGAHKRRGKLRYLGNGKI
jgi:hypothetical protein